MDRDLKTYYKIGIEKLEAAGIETPELDVSLMLMHTKRIDRLDFLTKEYVLDDGEEIKFYNMLEKRMAQMPMAYILQEKEFMSLPFYVNPSVLIPRPETELLVEAVLPYLKAQNLKTVLDLCTGSGCIAISLAKYGEVKVTAADVSAEAVEVARKNAARLGVEEKIEFLTGDLFEPLKKGRLFDVIVSNPPYIGTEELMGLMPTVLDYEPKPALWGGEDGLFFYQKIAEEAPKFLKEGGYLFLEIGCRQKANIMEILHKEGYNGIEVIKDLAGLDRVVYAVYGQKVQ